MYCNPLIPEVGGTERITSLISKGLSAIGHKCYGMLVITNNQPITYDGEPIYDLYTFLKNNDIDIAINQQALDTFVLEPFLKAGGQRWRDEGGKIVSCLHYDSRQTSAYYFFKNKLNKTYKDYYCIFKSLLFYKQYERKQVQAIGKVYKYIYENSDYFVTLSDRYNAYFKKVSRLNNCDKLTSIGNPLTFDTISDKRSLGSKQ